MNSSEFINLLRENGVVGGGGGSFPTYKKFSFNNLDTLIINGVECEPLLYSDYFLVKERFEEIIFTLQRLQEIFNFRDIFFTLKKKRLELADFLRKKDIENIKNLKFYLFEDIYPAGDEQIIIKAIKGITLPSFKLPGDYGIVVLNLQTLVFISEAIRGKPAIRRFVTVSGLVKNPLVFDVPIGTKIKDLIDISGGYLVDNPVIFAGGVMMGGIIGESFSIKKGTTGIIVIAGDSKLMVEKKTSADIFSKKARSVCDGCMECTLFCSRNLIGKKIRPHLIMRYSEDYLSGRRSIPSEVFNCSECGLCYVYSCPLGLSPRKVIKSLKEKSKRDVVEDFDESENFLFKIPPSYKIKKRLEIEDVKPNFHGVYNPSIISVDIKQSKGFSPKPIVKDGEFVLTGEKICKMSQNKLGVPLHSPVTGKIVYIDGQKIKIEASD